MVRFEALQSKGEVDRMLSSPLNGLKGAILNGLILAIVPWAALAQDTDGDGVGDIDDLYPEDSARSVNSPFFFTFDGTIDFASDSSEGKEPHGVNAGEAYRYTIVVDNHGGTDASQSWDRSDIEYLILTLNDDEDASILVDIANMRTVFGFGSSLTSPDPTLTSDESGALTKTWTNALFFGYSDDAVMDWYQNYGWLDDGIMVTQRLQALSDTVAEAIGPFSNQSGFAFTGVNQSARIEDPTEWSVAQPAECPGPLTVTNQQEANDVLSNLCARIRGDLNIQSASPLDLTPLRIVRTIDGLLNIDLPENTALDGLQGVSHVNGAAASDQDGDYHPDFMDHYPMDPAAAFDSDGDGLPDNWLPGFFGSNVTPDLAVDSDDDGDGVSDFEDAFPYDAAEIADADGDGYGDNADAFDDDPSEAFDSDADGIGNNADLDDDNDGFTDEEELADGTDPLNRFSCKSGCFSFDIDENSEAKALSDGLLVIRHLFGFSGDSLVIGATNADGGRTEPEAISSYLSDAEAELDIDGDGQSKALTDGLLLIRYLFGFSGDSLTAGAISEGAERKMAEEIQAYIEERVPSE